MSRIKLVMGDITLQDCDAIVNAANTTLLGGGGVDGAIHRAAGPELLEYCKKLNGCPVGWAKISPGFKLKAKHIIHTVGPVWSGGMNYESDSLARCYQNSLNLAIEFKVKSIAFPAISTGAFGFPAEIAAEIAVREVKAFLEKNDSIEQVIFVCFDEKNMLEYSKYI